MSSKRDEGQGEIFGQGLPGTGGDARRDGDQAARRDDDVEGHNARRDADPDGARRDGDQAARRDDDVEGHLYTGGPTTQGEFAKRGPSDNPHGER